MQSPSNWTIVEHPDMWSLQCDGIGATGFFCRVLPFSCSAEEIGSLFWRIGTPQPLARELIRRYLIAKGLKEYSTGITLVHFAKPDSCEDYLNKEWIELFKEAGFKQVVPEFENHAHKGNKILQLVYIHEKNNETQVQ